MTWPTEQAREAVARSLAAHWRDMHTNESLGLQRMLARHTLEALAPHVAALVRAERAAALQDAADDLEVLVDDQHPVAANPDQWLRDRAEAEEAGR